MVYNYRVVDYDTSPWLPAFICGGNNRSRPVRRAGMRWAEYMVLYCGEPRWIEDSAAFKMVRSDQKIPKNE